jgi:SSS family solute:Na+ symporter
LVVCALAAAITSTADSLLCAISSNIVQDFDFNFIKINKLKFSKIVTLVVGLLSIIVAYFSNDIIGILIQSYELSISCLFIPIFLCYFKVQLNKNAAILSVVMGFAGFVLFRFLSLPVPKELASLILSLFGYLIGSKLIKSN